MLFLNNGEQVNARLSFKYVIFFIAFPGSFIFSYQVLVNGTKGGKYTVIWVVFISNARSRSVELKFRQSNNATKNQMDYWKETVQIVLLNMVKS